MYSNGVINPQVHFQFDFEDAKRALWTVPIDLPYFDGHFPLNPILPAFGILDGTLEFMKLLTKTPRLHLKTVKNAKFLKPVVPGLSVQIEATMTGHNHWKCRWLSEDSVLVELNFVLQGEVGS
jgi:3-hydroxymyristoyl/3-hydroxydecanoyl-(acyl carrier protein) dehydratase